MTSSSSFRYIEQVHRLAQDFSTKDTVLLSYWDSPTTCCLGTSEAVLGGFWFLKKASLGSLLVGCYKSDDDDRPGSESTLVSLESHDLPC